MIIEDDCAKNSWRRGQQTLFCYFKCSGCLAPVKWFSKYYIHFLFTIEISIHISTVEISHPFLAFSLCSFPCSLPFVLSSPSRVFVVLLWKAFCVIYILIISPCTWWVAGWALDGWKFIKGAPDHYLPPENGLIDFAYRGGITAWRCGLCLRSVLSIICNNSFSSLSGVTWIWFRSLC